MRDRDRDTDTGSGFNRDPGPPFRTQILDIMIARVHSDTRVGLLVPYYDTHRVHRVTVYDTIGGAGASDCSTRPLVRSSSARLFHHSLHLYK